MFRHALEPKSNQVKAMLTKLGGGGGREGLFTRVVVLLLKAVSLHNMCGCQMETTDRIL